MLQLLLTLLAIAWTACAALANDEQDCFQSPEPQLRIKGCSELIERAPEDATAYHNRAFAYGLAGDADKAIEDYSKVIALAPSTASAYANRGRAYASKGDYVHAVADETKAQELMARAKAQPAEVAPKPAKTPKKTAAVPKATAAAPKATAAAPKATASPPKDKAVANPGDNAPPQGAPSSSWWSWLWGNAGGDQAGSKNGKP
jgi:tetratricopeptide (TPR) repeat protein